MLSLLVNTYTKKYPFSQVLCGTAVVLLLVGIIAHRVFRVNTALNVKLFGVLK